jgi:hypothetical protein
MFSYPVHRQTWPDIASRTSAAVGSGLLSSSQRAVIIMPGVQKPHCRPWHSMNPCWTGSSWPFLARSSTVRTERPSAIAASTVHALTGVSSSHTTQLPQLDVSQPQWLPVRPSWSRRKWMSSSRGSTSRAYSVPFTVTATRMVTFSLAGRLGRRRGSRRGGARGW